MSVIGSLSFTLDTSVATPGVSLAIPERQATGVVAVPSQSQPTVVVTGGGAAPITPLSTGQLSAPLSSVESAVSSLITLAAVAGESGLDASVPPSSLSKMAGLSQGQIAANGSASQSIDLNALAPTSAGAELGFSGSNLADASGVSRGFAIARLADGTATVASASASGSSSTEDRLFVFQGMAASQSNSTEHVDIQVPGLAFAHTNPGAVVRLEASLSDGMPLPGWLKFDPASGVFRGVPPAPDAEAVDVRLTARDDAGREATLVFRPVLASVASSPVSEASVGSARANGLGGSGPLVDVVERLSSVESGSGVGNLSAAATLSGISGAPSPAGPLGFPVERVSNVGGSTAVGVVDSGASGGPARLFVFQGVRDVRSTSAEGFEFQVPKDAFAHTDASAVVRLEASLADGSALPVWLKFDAGTGTLSGTPPAQLVLDIDVKITARDQGGREATVVFKPILSSAISVSGATNEVIGEQSLKVASSQTAEEVELTAVSSKLSSSPQDLVRGKQQEPGPAVSAPMSFAPGEPQVGVRSDAGFALLRIPEGAESSGRGAADGGDGPRLFVYHGLPDGVMSVGKGFQIPSDVFAHTDTSAIVRLEAHLADGTDLPAWLRFDPVTGTFGGIAPVGFGGALSIEIIARDDQGREARLMFNLTVEADSGSTSAADQFSGERVIEALAEAGEYVDPVKSEPNSPSDSDAKDAATVKVKKGAPTFSEQIRTARAAKNPFSSGLTGSRVGELVEKGSKRVL